MKRTVITLLSLALTGLALVFGASAATCEHNWRIDFTKCVAPTCTKAGSNVYTCSRCSGTKTETVAATGHDYVKNSTLAATCTEKGNVIEKCSVCGDERTTETAALGHDFKETTRKAATCLSAGSVSYKCSRCTETKSETLTVLGHDFSKYISTSATCLKAGQSTYQCSRCDELTLKSVAKLGHSYVKSGGPTCTEAGKYVNTCSRCGDTYTDTKSTKALGHDLPDADSSQWRVTKKATCEETGSRRAKCSRCSQYITEDIPALEHEYSDELYLIKAPTKTTAGKAQQTCENCGKSLTETIKRGTTDLSDYTVPPIVSSHDSDVVLRGTKITLECDLEDATIYYALGGKSPTSKTYRKTYSEPITITESTTVKAYAVYEDNEDVESSDLLTLSFIVKSGDSWLYLEADASDGGYMSLESGKKFRPDDNASRYEVLEAMDPLFGSWAEDADVTFTDVTKEHKDIVAKFVGADLLDGYEDKTFRGEENIKRSELCKLLVLALDMETSKTDTIAFKDVSVTHWAYEYIAALTKAGYLKGDTAGTFRPEDPVSRAELVTVLNRIADIDNAKGVTITDVPTTHWAYGYICAAVK